MSYESDAKRLARLAEEWYTEAVTAEALARQERAKVERHACCWEPLTGPHHPACQNADDPDAPPPLIEGQASLL